MCSIVIFRYISSILNDHLKHVIELRIDAYFSLPGLGTAQHVVIRDIYPNRNIFVVCIQFPFIREEESVLYHDFSTVSKRFPRLCKYITYIYCTCPTVRARYMYYC